MDRFGGWARIKLIKVKSASTCALIDLCGRIVSTDLTCNCKRLTMLVNELMIPASVDRAAYPESDCVVSPTDDLLQPDRKEEYVLLTKIGATSHM